MNYKVTIVRNDKIDGQAIWSQKAIETWTPDEAKALADPACRGTITKGKTWKQIIEKI